MTFCSSLRADSSYCNIYVKKLHKDLSKMGLFILNNFDYNGNMLKNSMRMIISYKR